MTKRTDVADFIGTLSGGQVQSLLEQMLSEVAMATAVNGEKGKTGEINIKLNFARVGDEGSNQVKIDTTVSHKSPTKRGSKSENLLYANSMHYIGTTTGLTDTQPRKVDPNNV